MKEEYDFAALLACRITTLMREKDRDLTLRQLAVLLICCTSKQPWTVKGLAIRLMIPTPSITRAVDHLERAGLVKRGDNPDDWRSVLVTITPDGKRYAARFFGGYEAGRRKVIE
ncbi:MarR family transcriptional regulator [Acidisoma cladoniae]|uniref:MarR family transcriptional regulator n=1 Tax=Acidisoma cladoniae TaxID=3040935 RepID=UPI00254B6F19|nr:MarR family transcriptional regulator [Acidisoma sp. PAMC 29798]